VSAFCRDTRRCRPWLFSMVPASVSAVEERCVRGRGSSASRGRAGELCVGMSLCGPGRSRGPSGALAHLGLVATVRESAAASMATGGVAPLAWLAAGDARPARAERRARLRPPRTAGYARASTGHRTAGPPGPRPPRRADSNAPRGHRPRGDRTAALRFVINGLTAPAVHAFDKPRDGPRTDGSTSGTTERRGRGGAPRARAVAPRRVWRRVACLQDAAPLVPFVILRSSDSTRFSVNLGQRLRKLNGMIQ
jgi:hypothetical protein